MANMLRSRVLITIAVIFFAGSIRFFKLGDWPFAGDELATMEETRSFFMETNYPSESQIHRLPRAIPLSSLFQGASTKLFGNDEYGSRVVMAVLGSLSAGLIFFCFDSLHGRAVAFATTLLLTLWPDHVFYSQQTRFYMIAAFFALVCILIGALVVRRHSTSVLVILGCAIFAAVLCHTLLVVLLPMIFAGIIAAAVAERRSVQKEAFLVFIATLVSFFVFFVFYLAPLLGDWNSGATWGYGVVHSILASLNMVGWPVALLGGIGFVMLLSERSGLHWYWVLISIGWGASTVIFPLLISHHPAYVFPVAIGLVVPAGFAIGKIYSELRAINACTATAWIGLVCLVNLPSLVSHFRDGSRPDVRTAAKYVEEHWQEGDRLTGFWIDLVSHYADDCRPAIALPDSGDVDVLNELAKDNSRLWVVVQSNRSGLQPRVRRWLGNHCSYELEVRRTRFDYAVNRVEVFLYTPDPDQS